MGSKCLLSNKTKSSKKATLVFSRRGKIASEDTENALILKEFIQGSRGNSKIS